MRNSLENLKALGTTKSSDFPEKQKRDTADTAFFRVGRFNSVLHFLFGFISTFFGFINGVNRAKIV
jgi:hypothetical protein